MPANIDGLTVVLTGAAQGIGANYARFLAAHGARVVMADIDEVNLLAVEKEILGQGGAVAAIKTDVSSEQDVEQMVRFALKRFGRIDGLINDAALCAALFPRRCSLDIDAALWDRVMAVNVRGPFFCCRAVIPHMRKQKSGSIINTSSNTILSGGPGLLHYVTSKSAQVGLTRSLAKEFGPDGIRVNIIMPGMVETEGVVAGLTDADRQRAVSARSLRRAQEPGDLNGTIAFLLSSESAMITGQIFNVDGGALFN